MIPLVVGLSHKTAPVDVREQLAFKPTALADVCRRIISADGAPEAMVLSTCNRVEVYAVASSPDEGFNRLSRFLAECANGYDHHKLNPHLYHYPGNEAIGHIFRVASSLDSMVLGEPQILGQFKNAFDSALTAKSTGTILNKIAQKAISVAKRVRTETRIAENAVSVSYAAVELARKVFSDLSQKRVMLLGAGEMAELALRHLINGGVQQVLVSTRTLANAEALVEQFCTETEIDAQAVPFEDFADTLTQVDIVICSTGAPEPVISRQMAEAVISARKHQPIFMVDISVPRNIAPDVNQVNDVYLYDIDDLQQVVDANLAERQEEATKALSIVEQEVDTTARWIRSLDVVPTITALRTHAEAIAAGETVRLLGKLGHLSEKDRKLIEGIGPAIVAKLLHLPLSNLRREAQNDNDQQMVDVTRRLFSLTDDERPTSTRERGKKTTES